MSLTSVTKSSELAEKMENHSESGLEKASRIAMGTVNEEGPSEVQETNPLDVEGIVISKSGDQAFAEEEAFGPCTEMSARTAPTTAYEQQRVRDEREIAETFVTPDNVVYITQKHLVRRQIRQYDEIQESLRFASKCLDSKHMIDHIEKIADGLGSRRESERTLIREKLVEYRQILENALATYDVAEVRDVQGALEAIILRYDQQYLEHVETKKFLLKRAVRENKPPQPPPTWLQNPTYRLFCLFRGDITGEKANVSVDEQRWFLARAAWVVAISLMIVAIAFVSADFYRSRTIPALSTNVLRQQRLQLPVVYACLSMPQIPTFADMINSSYAGRPLWGLRSYTNKENGETYIYPATHEMVSEPTYLGPKEFCDSSMPFLSKKRIEHAMNFVQDAPRCFSCLRVGRKKPVWIEHSKALVRASGAVTLEFSTSKEIDFCYTRSTLQNVAVRQAMKDALKRQSSTFVDRGIIVMLNPSDANFALDFGFEPIEQLGDTRRLIVEEATVFCNLYLFSGVFYPVESGTEIRYSFNMSDGVNAWKMLEDESKYLRIAVDDVPVVSEISVNRSMLFNELQKASMTGATRFALSINMYSVDNTSTTPRYRDFSVLLRENHHDILFFTKKVEEGVAHFQSMVQLGVQKVFLAISSYRRFNVSLDFATFDVEVATKVPTTTVAEYLTDVFEYVGLFTGVCAFSLLVSPARMYLRRLQKYEQEQNQN